MEKDDIKNTWEKYDQHLSQNLRVDEDKLRNSCLFESKEQMDYPFVSEKVELYGNILVATIVLVLSLRLADDLKYLLFGLIVVAIGVVFTRMAIKKIKLLKRINYYNTPIVKLQRELAFTKLRIHKMRKVEMVLFPLYLIALMPITSATLHGADPFENIIMFVVKAAGALILAYIGVFLIHKYLYDKRFKKVEQLIRRIKEFEQE